MTCTQLHVTHCSHISMPLCFTQTYILFTYLCPVHSSIFSFTAVHLCQEVSSLRAFTHRKFDLIFPTASMKHPRERHVKRRGFISNFRVEQKPFLRDPRIPREPGVKSAANGSRASPPKFPTSVFSSPDNVAAAELTLCIFCERKGRLALSH